MAVRVLITDDHPVVREGLEFMLGAHDEIEIVGGAADGEETLRYIPVLRPDVVIMDLRLPGEDGAEVTKRVKAAHPEVKVLVLTAEADAGLFRRAVAAGADGFLLKSAKAAELAAAVCDIAAGRSVVTPSLTGALFAAAREQVAQPSSPLSEREQQVLQLLADGRTNKEIAAELYVSEATVKTHVENILRKLGVSDRTQAVAEAFRRGLVA
ncbi:MAG: DNA-binding response regulator [Acidimicrobiia bacterium]